MAIAYEINAFIFNVYNQDNLQLASVQFQKYNKKILAQKMF